MCLCYVVDNVFAGVGHEACTVGCRWDLALAYLRLGVLYDNDNDACGIISITVDLVPVVCS